MRSAQSNELPPTRKPPSAQAPLFIQLSLGSTNRVPRAIEAPAKLRFALLAVGCGNVLLVPGFVARAEAAGLALGDKAPVRLTSRGDYDRARLVSSALA
jgi:hypothetical protein